MKDFFTKNCTLCPRNCSVDRTQNHGFCGVGSSLKVARAGLHYYEEPCVSGTNGSGAIFFSGCNMGCTYCQNREISNRAFGKEISPARLAEIFFELENAGAETINLVTPSHFVPQICESLSIYRPKVPVVYNTSAYEKVETLELIAPYVDVWLPDMKYADSSLAKSLSASSDYPEVAMRAISFMTEQKPTRRFNGQGIMTCGVIVRHLVLPGHTDNSVKVLDMLTPMRGKFLLSIMSQFTPLYPSDKHPELNGKITPLEYKRVLAYAQRLGLTDGFIQELDSASEDFVPSFDLTGV